MGDSDSEEMEMPVVQKRVTQPSRPVPAVPRVVAPQARRESARPPASLVSAPGTLAKPKMPPPQLMKFTDEDESVGAFFPPPTLPFLFSDRHCLPEN